MIKLPGIKPVSLVLIILILTASASYLGYQLFAEKHILYVSLGDSLAQGYPYYLEKKPYGYTDNIYNELKVLENSNYKVDYVNYGTIGYTSTDLLHQISREDVILNISKADIITVNIGGNDMLKALNTKDLNNYEMLLDSINKYSDNLASIFTKIRSLNPTVHIYMANLFNPSTPNDKTNYAMADYMVSYINKVIRDISLPYKIKIIAVDTIFKGHEYGTSANPWFYDKIHPDKRGYLEMSKPFSKAILNDIHSKDYFISIRRYIHKP